MIHHFFTGTVLREKWLRYPLLKKVIDHVEINSSFFMIPCFSRRTHLTSGLEHENPIYYRPILCLLKAGPATGRDYPPSRSAI
jgi:hypothetical protein